MSEPFWECVLCAATFTSLEGWQAHVAGRPGSCPPSRPVLTENDVRRIVNAEIVSAVQRIRTRNKWQLHQVTLASLIIELSATP